MSESAILQRRIPEWLAPYKNEWRSMSTMGALMHIEGGSLAKWLSEVRPRLKCVKKQINSTGAMASYYLVKQVWAFSLAHGVTLSPSTETRGQAARIKELENKVHALHGALMIERSRAPVTKIVSPPDMAKMLTSMLTATEPRPLPGVYFLISDGVVTYVGQSQNVLARMSGHAGKKFDTVKMLYEPDPTDRLTLEGRWILAFKPRDNVMGMFRNAA